MDIAQIAVLDHRATAPQPAMHTISTHLCKQRERTGQQLHRHIDALAVLLHPAFLQQRTLLDVVQQLPPALNNILAVALG